MKDVLRQIYSAKIESLGKLKAEDSSKYQTDLDEFLTLVLKSSKDAEELTKATKDLTTAASAFMYPIANSEAKAQQVYQKLPESRMRSILQKAASSMYKAEYANNAFEVYRMMFIQVEILFAYLELKYDFKSWVKQENMLIETHNKEIDKTGQGTVKYTYTITDRNGIGVGSKPYVLNDYFSRLQGGDLIASTTITLVRNMRDYASHGYHESKSTQMRSTIGDASANLDLYVEKWVNFLTSLTTYLI